MSSSTNIDKIAELLAWNVPKPQIAAAIGVTEDKLVDFINSNEHLKELVQRKSAGIAVRELSKRVTEADVEQKILQRMEQVAGEEESIGALSMALHRLRQSHVTAAKPVSETHLHLQLGVVAQNIVREIPIQQNDRKEIVNIDGREMATLPASKVLELVKERKNERKASGEVSASSEEVAPTDF